jgi:hypothetical protein
VRLAQKLLGFFYREQYEPLKKGNMYHGIPSRKKAGRKRFWDLCDDSICLVLLDESQGRCMGWYLLTTA